MDRSSSRGELGQTNFLNVLCPSTCALPGSWSPQAERALARWPRQAKSETIRPCSETARVIAHQWVGNTGSGAKAGALDGAVPDTGFNGLPSYTNHTPVSEVEWLTVRTADALSGKA
jgi:hypothetical protein